MFVDVILFFKRTVHHLSNVSANIGLVTCIHSYCKVTPKEKVIVESIIRAIREPFRRIFEGHDFYIVVEVYFLFRG